MILSRFRSSSDGASAVSPTNIISTDPLKGYILKAKEVEGKIVKWKRKLLYFDDHKNCLFIVKKGGKGVLFQIRRQIQYNQITFVDVKEEALNRIILTYKYNDVKSSESMNCVNIVFRALSGKEWKIWVSKFLNVVHEQKLKLKKLSLIGAPPSKLTQMSTREVQPMSMDNPFVSRKDPPVEIVSPDFGELKGPISSRKRSSISLSEHIEIKMKQQKHEKTDNADAFESVSLEQTKDIKPQDEFDKRRRKVRLKSIATFKSKELNLATLDLDKRLSITVARDLELSALAMREKEKRQGFIGTCQKILSYLPCFR